ncbi:MAG: phosphoglucosamine mutase [Candidatus Woesearchaeota archaeon]|nr:phosphoglucosamine mutase [Candidatus Woesearchaeota archaeon]
MRLFGTDGVRGKANKYPITAEIALKLGKAAAKVLKTKDKPVFLIGKDTRLSGYMLENALTAGLTSMGADVFLVGPVPTPTVAHLIRSFNVDAGIMISASHNPYTDNGIKFFDEKGHKLPDETEEKIEKAVFEDINTEHVDSKSIGRAYRIDDAKGRYIESAKASINNISLKGLKVVIDCANGAAYKVAPYILKELGAEVVVLNNQPDGNNINLECGALHPEVLKAAVLGHGADVGITLDGDADRIIMVDEKGNILDGDFILAIAGLEFLRQGKLKKDTVVVTEYTNLAFDELFRKHKGNVVRVQNGDRYVIEEMLDKGYNVGGEASGHVIFSDFNSTGDGMIAGLQVLRIMKEKKKRLSELNPLVKFPQVIINVIVKEKKPIEKMKNVMDEIKEAEKILGKNGRHLIRYSGTEMKARVMIEGKDKAMIEKLANRIAAEIRKEVG